MSYPRTSLLCLAATLLSVVGLLAAMASPPEVQPAAVGIELNPLALPAEFQIGDAPILRPSWQIALLDKDDKRDALDPDPYSCGDQSSSGGAHAGWQAPIRLQLVQ